MAFITIKRLIEEGYEAYYIIATNGENGCKDPSLSRHQRIKIRKEEQLKAAKEIGVKDVIFIGYKDGFLKSDDTLIKRLAILIKEIKPELVFSFDPANKEFNNLNQNHRDHRAIAEAVFDACFAAKNDYIYPHKNGSHKVKRIYFFGSHSPGYFVNITKDMQYKLDVILFHKSQFPDAERFSKWFKGNLARFTNKFKYSEAFRILEVE
jgi:LmbE family N-acetylglucosaminyl deacetylase